MKIIEKKTIPVSSKRQITIPVKYFKALEIDTEIECFFTGDEIILKPVSLSSGYFAQEILNDLIDKGYTGEELKKAFAIKSKEIRPAVKSMLKDVSQFAKEAVKNYIDETEDIFNLEGTDE